MFSILFLMAKTWLVSWLISCSVCFMVFSFSCSLNPITALCFSCISAFNAFTTACCSIISSCSLSNFFALPILFPSNKPILPPVKVNLPFTYLPVFSSTTAPLELLITSSFSAIKTFDNKW